MAMTLLDRFLGTITSPSTTKKKGAKKSVAKSSDLIGAVSDQVKTRAVAYKDRRLKKGILSALITDTVVERAVDVVEAQVRARTKKK
jgi:hypothetical protein